MDKKRLFNFPVLDFQLQSAENYTALALKMQYNLRAFGVCSYVQSILKCPSTATPSSYASSDSQSHTTSVVTQDQWVRTDEQIMAYIMRSISIPIRMSIGHSISSREQWLALSHMFV